ncbi:MAG: 3-keto-disaccharide hydrolase [Luteolibacter sp.]
MKTIQSIVTAILFAAGHLQAEGWIQLFDGKSLDGWTPKFADMKVGENHHNIFRVEDGVLKVSYDKAERFDGRFGHLFYKNPYSHYRIRAEFRFTGDQLPGSPGWAFRNNGLMLHSQAPETMSVEQKFPNSLELQFLGNDESKGAGYNDRRMGNLFTPGTKVSIGGVDSEGGNNTSNSELFSGMEWVTVEAEVRGGEEIIHFVNGKEVLRYQNPRLDDGTPLTQGYIAIQAETHGTEFRKIELLPLKAD